MCSKLKNLPAGTNVDSYFVVRKADLRTKKDGGTFLNLELGNKNGRIPAILWDASPDVQSRLKPQNVVKVRGRITVYNDITQITVQSIEPVNDTTDAIAAELLPSYPGDIQELITELQGLITEIENPFVKKLLHTVFTDSEFAERFFRAPGGKLWHHGYIGGLAHHTLSMVKICKRASEIHPLADKDLLICGALLHDIGKVWEYRYFPYIDFTDAGRLHNHMTIGYHYIAGKIEEIAEFPETLKNKILHMILSHQGQPQKGSPVAPMTLEGIILHFADEMDAQANAYSRIISEENNAGVSWSKYVNLIERYIYFGDE